LLAQPGGIDADHAIGGEEVGLVLELPQPRLQVRPLPAACGLPGRSADQRGNLLIEPELLPALGRGRRAAQGRVLADHPGEVQRRVDPLLRSNHRVGADLAEYAKQASQPLLGVHLDSDLAATDLRAERHARYRVGAARDGLRC
jgi:hypothetical protein